MCCAQQYADNQLHDRYSHVPVERGNTMETSGNAAETRSGHAAVDTPTAARVDLRDHSETDLRQTGQIFV